MSREAIPLRRVISVSPTDDGGHVLVRFEGEEDGFPSLALPVDQIATLAALLIGANGKKRVDGKPVGIVSPDRCQAFTHPSDKDAIFVAMGIGSFDLAFALPFDKAAQLDEALVEALSLAPRPGTPRIPRS